MTSYPEAWAGVECTRVRIGRAIRNELDLTGHRDRIKDLDLLASLGVSSVRYPLLWEEIAPHGLANADWRWADERMVRMRELGLRPIVGLLHHGAGPAGMSLGHPNFPSAFATFALAVARRYPWIDAFIPINEPFTTARFSALYGWWHPHLSSMDACATVLLNECLAIRAASAAIRSINAGASMIVNEDVGHSYSTPAMAPHAQYLNERRWLTWDILMGRITPDHAMYAPLTSTPRNRALLAEINKAPFAPDVLGVDHYVTSDRYIDENIDAYPPVYSDSGNAPFADVEACRIDGPPGASVERALAETWDRYRLPIALTEISLAGDAHDQVAWWDEAWDAAVSARRCGIDVAAVTAWAALGAVDWHCTLTRTDDIYEPGAFDIRGNVIVERPVAGAIREAAALRATDGSWSTGEPVAVNSRHRHGGSGWWNRPDRFIHAT
jgi:dTDP-4-dehydrorhamnose reductase